MIQQPFKKGDEVVYFRPWNEADTFVFHRCVVLSCGPKRIKLQDTNQVAHNDGNSVVQHDIPVDDPHGFIMKAFLMEEDEACVLFGKALAGKYIMRRLIDLYRASLQDEVIPSHEAIHRNITRFSNYEPKCYPYNYINRATKLEWD